MAPATPPAAPAALLFDLDGTLIDSAPDLAAATNAMRAHRGLAQLPLEQLRPHVGSGARGMLSSGFGMEPGHSEYESYRIEFLERYSTMLLVSTVVFEAMHPVLAALNVRRVPWGIVTNKALALARPIVSGLAPLHAARCVVGGDSTPHRKPHPAPLLFAAQALNVTPQDCLYVGDDPRDMQAGKAAGMRTVAAGWGYLGEALPIHEWQADHIAETPQALHDLLSLPLRSGELA